SLGTWDTGSVSVDVPAINLILDTEVAGSYGLYASIGPVVTLYGPAIDFGSLQFAGDDLILHPGSFTLPGVDFGTATFKFCVVDCVSGSTHIGMVGGDKIEPFSDITFAGANPFKDFDLNAGSGIAFIGQGEVTVTGPGAYFDVKLTLDMNEILGPVTDLFSDIISNNPIKPISDLFSEGFDISIADELGVAMIFPEITLEERITLLDPIETEKYTVDENGIVVITGVPGQTKTYTVDENGLCVVFGASSCERKRVITLDSSHEEDGTVTTLQNRYGSNQMESWEHEETIVFVPANLEGAQADLIVTTDSHLTHSKNNNTSLSDGAQRNLTAMNAVNATNAVIGNASNMMAYRAQMTYSGTQLQSNQFVQNR
ncbi:MAG: hypothetical protein OEY89_17585, partial [Gammaproteobacteria bacterium]|nr:hypothetical protein [Gammaproteobacteria bacterium]